MRSNSSHETNLGRTAGDQVRKENWFTVTTVPYIPPSCLSGCDARCDQGLALMIYLQTLVDEEIDSRIQEPVTS